jgi:hypothetical protein
MALVSDSHRVLIPAVFLSMALLNVPYICLRDSGPGKSTRRRGQCLRNRGDRGLRPISVGGLQAPTNWILSSEIHCLSEFLQKPCYSVNCLRNVMTGIVPYLS